MQGAGMRGIPTVSSLTSLNLFNLWSRLNGFLFFASSEQLSPTTVHKGRNSLRFALPSAVCSEPKPPAPNMPFLGVWVDVLKQGVPRWPWRSFLQCRAELTTHWSLPTALRGLSFMPLVHPSHLLLYGRKTTCNFKLAALQLLGERLEVSGGKERAAQGSQRPVFSDFTKCSLRIVSKNNLNISKNSSSWGILRHSCVGKINLEISINATVELLTSSPL